jgi:uncharacterized protein (TIGR02246 family)
MKATVWFHAVTAFAVTVAAAFPSVNAAEREEDDKMVRQRTAEFVQALESGVAADIAACWTSEGEYVGSDGDPIRGQESLKTAYDFSIAEGGKPTVSHQIEAVRFLSADTAVVNGVFESVRGEEYEPSRAGFSILYVREDGQWQIAVLRESPHETTLRDLDWLIGKWSIKSDDRTVQTSYFWGDGESFIFMQFTVDGEDRKTTGRQIIGQDPATGAIRSWLFQSGGGLGEALWTRDGKDWRVDTSGVSADGSELTATNIYTPQDKDSFSFRSIDRTLNGEELDDIGPITVTRVEEDAEKETE